MSDPLSPKSRKLRDFRVQKLSNYVQEDVASQGREDDTTSDERGNEDGPDEDDPGSSTRSDDQADDEDGDELNRPNGTGAPRTPPALPVAQVRCNITFGEKPAPHDPARWPSTSVTRPATDTLAVLYEEVKNIIVANLQQDQRLLQQLRDQRRILAFHLTISNSVCNETVINPMETEHPFTTIGDIFADTAPLMTVDATVEIIWQTRPKPHRDQLEWDFNKGSYSNLAVKDLVFERMYVDPSTDRNTYVYVRLGEVPADSIEPPPEGATHSSNSKVTENPGYEAWLRGGKEGDIASEDTLLGYYFDYDPEKLQIIKVRAWVFGDLCIGNCVDHWAKHKFNDQDVYFEPFRSAKDPKGLHKLVRQYLKARNDVGDTEAQGIPFQPTYTLNSFDPAHHGLGATVEYAHIVVSFVTHIDLGYTGRDPAQAIPWNVQFDVDRADGAGQIKARLRHDLEKWSEHEDTHKNAQAAVRKLFEGPLRGRWRFELWVLPQGLKKMYRFSPGHVDEQDGLSQFLDKKLVVSNEKHRLALYVEAHIVEIGEAEEDVEFEEIVEEVPSDQEDQNVNPGAGARRVDRGGEEVRVRRM